MESTVPVGESLFLTVISHSLMLIKLRKHAVKAQRLRQRKPIIEEREERSETILTFRFAAILALHGWRCTDRSIIPVTERHSLLVLIIENDVYGLNKKNTETTLDRLDYWLEFLSNMPRNKAKLLRNTISVGPNQMEETISFLKSRGYAAFFKNKNEQNIWYDATEIMDLYIGAFL